RLVDEGRVELVVRLHLGDELVRGGRVDFDIRLDELIEPELAKELDAQVAEGARARLGDADAETGTREVVDRADLASLSREDHDVRPGDIDRIEKEVLHH